MRSTLRRPPVHGLALTVGADVAPGGTVPPGIVGDAESPGSAGSGDSEAPASGQAFSPVGSKMQAIAPWPMEP